MKQILCHSLIVSMLAIATPAFAGKFLAITNAMTDEVTYHYELKSDNYEQKGKSYLYIRFDWNKETTEPSIVLRAPDDHYPPNGSGARSLESQFRVFPNPSMTIQHRPSGTNWHESTIETKCKEIMQQIVSDNAEKCVLPKTILSVAAGEADVITVPLTADDKANIRKLVQVWLGRSHPSTLF